MSSSRAWTDLGGGVTGLVEHEVDDRTDEQVEHDATAHEGLADVVAINRVRHKSTRYRPRPATGPPAVEPTDEGRAIIASIRAQLRGPRAPAGAHGGNHAP